MRRVAKLLSGDKRFFGVLCGYLEINKPSIPDAIIEAVRMGADEVRILPYFLLTGRHVNEDIPRIVKEAKKTWKNKVKIILCPYIGFDPKIVSLVKKRITQIER